MLHLPDVAQLVADEVVAGPLGRLAKQDRLPGRVAVEATEPGQAEEKRNDEDADAVDPHRSRVEIESVEPALRARERSVRQSEALAASAAAAGCRPATAGHSTGRRCEARPPRPSPPSRPSSGRPAGRSDRARWSPSAAARARGPRPSRESGAGACPPSP